MEWKSGSGGMRRGRESGVGIRVHPLGFFPIPEREEGKGRANDFSPSSLNRITKSRFYNEKMPDFDISAEKRY